MIRNEKQYKIARSWLNKFEDGKAKLDELPPDTNQPWLRKAQRGSLRAQIKQLRDEISEYEAVKNGKVDLPSLEPLSSLPELLIKRRIANGWTLQHLADVLGLHQQQIQRYESTNYATATFGTIQRVAAALQQHASAAAKTRRGPARRGSRLKNA